MPLQEHQRQFLLGSETVSTNNRLVVKTNLKNLDFMQEVRAALLTRLVNRYTGALQIARAKKKPG